MNDPSICVTYLKNTVSMQAHDDSIQDSFPPVFVINLERNTDRRISIEAQFTQAGLGFEIHAATDGARLAPSDLALYDEDYVFDHISRTLSPSEIGCYLSHQKIWQRILDDKIPWAVVLEDDVLIQAALKDIFAQIGKLPFKWDLIRLAGLLPTPHVHVSRLTGDFRLTAPLQGASGTQAYCISRRGAQKLLSFSTMIRGTVDDNVIDNCWKTGLRILAVHPYPITEDKAHVSNIQEERKKIFQTDRDSRDDVKGGSIRENLIRRRYKVNKSLAKRAYYLVHLFLATRLRLGWTFYARLARSRRR